MSWFFCVAEDVFAVLFCNSSLISASSAPKHFLERVDPHHQSRARPRPPRFASRELLPPRRGDALRGTLAAVHVPHHVEGRDDFAARRFRFVSRATVVVYFFRAFSASAPVVARVFRLKINPPPPPTFHGARTHSRRLWDTTRPVKSACTKCAQRSPSARRFSRRRRTVFWAPRTTSAGVFL